MKWSEWEVLHVNQMKWLVIRILHVSWNEIERIGGTSSKTNEMARNENTSCKLKWNLTKPMYLM